MDGFEPEFHEGASDKLFGYAKQMRKDATNAERLLWQRLRNKKVSGLKFRRQHPLFKFIADFYCHEKKLVIELDGSIHNDENQKQIDNVRTFELNELKLTVIRFRNEEVLNHIEQVIKKIIEIAERL
jgi:very-short-patch-repair endonuclease